MVKDFSFGSPLPIVFFQKKTSFLSSKILKKLCNILYLLLLSSTFSFLFHFFFLSTTVLFSVILFYDYFFSAHCFWGSHFNCLSLCYSLSYSRNQYSILFFMYSICRIKMLFASVFTPEKIHCLPSSLIRRFIYTVCSFHANLPLQLFSSISLLSFTHFISRLSFIRLFFPLKSYISCK